MMIAEVYVDLPAEQVNKCFDFRIPMKWQETVVPGMRVVVPFGSRKLLGFITKIKLKSTIESEKLREVTELLDLQPVLNAELLELGEWLATETICYNIIAYQAMLPAALKGKYEKKIALKQGISAQDLTAEIQSFFTKKTEIPWKQAIESEQIYLFQAALKAGLLELHIQITDKLKVKAKRFVARKVAIEVLQEKLAGLRTNANQKRKAIAFFIENQEPVEIASLTNQYEISSQIIRELIKEDLLQETKVEAYRDPYQDTVFTRTEHQKLTVAQTVVLTPIQAAIEVARNESFLLYGITGSGKTEVYMQAIETCLQAGKQAIMLVPEISLTPQMVSRFKSRFGEQVAVLHSGLSSGEKYDEWRKIYREEVSVVVGARSAIFAPFTKLGIIIIDEEHEYSYKQEEAPRYHAREVAIKRSAYHRCPVVLGSATPSLESFARARKKIYTLLMLPERINRKQLPNVSVVDMREELRHGNRSMFSKELFAKIQDRLAKKEQTILMLNRRGYSSFVMCRNCGLVINCPQCDVSMTYHYTTSNLKCHYCGYECHVPHICPDCSSDHIRFFGTGTQKVEVELGKLLPTARVIRMDIDTTRTKGAHEKLLKKFEEKQADILLGTQMIAKGLDFPLVSLVGVLSADTSLHLADFRASERTFQLLTQVSGRAGRHDISGEVVIQTYTPEHYSVELAAKQDYLAFYQREMMTRRQTGFSPFYNIVLFHISHPDLLKTIEAAKIVYDFLKRELSDQVLIFGPTASPISKVNNRYRYQCLLKYKKEPELLTKLNKLNEQFGLNVAKTGVFLSIDIHPLMMM